MQQPLEILHSVCASLSAQSLGRVEENQYGGRMKAKVVFRGFIWFFKLNLVKQHFNEREPCKIYLVILVYKLLYVVYML